MEKRNHMLFADKYLSRTLLTLGIISFVFGINVNESNIFTVIGWTLSGFIIRKVNSISTTPPLPQLLQSLTA
ncbi:MAG: hypothetical protein K0S39_2966 [Paenibacillus sp.]|jgi:hypothetical protein|nr:hypothetical protein [Paenibacillus sp.]